MAYSLKTIVNDTIRCKADNNTYPLKHCRECEWHGGDVKRSFGSPAVKCLFGMSELEKEWADIKQGLCPKCGKTYTDLRHKEGKYKGHGSIRCVCGWGLMI